MSCSKDEIQAECQKKPPVDRVETAEWGGDGHVFVRAMLGSEAGSIRKFDVEGSSEEEQETNAIIGWCVLGVCDEEGNRKFDDDDASWLGEGPLGPIMRCAQATMKLNGVTEDLVGNSDESQIEDSLLS